MTGTAKHENLFFNYIDSVCSILPYGEISSTEFEDFLINIYKHERKFHDEIIENIRKYDKKQNLNYYQSIKRRLIDCINIIKIRYPIKNDNDFNLILKKSVEIQKKYFMLMPVVLGKDPVAGIVVNHLFIISNILDNHISLDSTKSIDIIEQEIEIQKVSQKDKLFEDCFKKLEYIEKLFESLRKETRLTADNKIIPFENINKDILAIIEVLVLKGYCETIIPSHRKCFLKKLSDKKTDDGYLRKMGISNQVLRNKYIKIIPDLNKVI